MTVWKLYVEALDGDWTTIVDHKSNNNNNEKRQKDMDQISENLPAPVYSVINRSVARSNGVNRELVIEAECILNLLLSNK